MKTLVSRVVQHWELKLLALVFAIALWVFVAAEGKTQALYEVPLDVADVPPGLAVAGLGVEVVAVRVQGLRHVLEQLHERDLRAHVSLRGARPGETVVRIRPGDVTVPRGVEVVRVTPSQVRATLQPAVGTASP